MKTEQKQYAANFVHKTNDVNQKHFVVLYKDQVFLSYNPNHRMPVIVKMFLFYFVLSNRIYFRLFVLFLRSDAFCL